MLVPLVNNLTHSDSIECGFLLESQKLPLVIICRNTAIDICDWFKSNSEELISLHRIYGALLFRGFDVTTAEVFEHFVTQSTSIPMNTYKERQLKRDRVKGNVFTSTSHIKSGSIFLHNEQSFNLVFPKYIYFNCHTVADSKGCTPLADTREIYKKIPAEIKDKFLKYGYLYKRNFMQHIYVDWQWSFQTEKKDEVEEYCREFDIEYHWPEQDGLVSLKTSQLRHIGLIHPDTKEACWFNHCTAFNNRILESNIRKLIENSFDEDEYPNHTYYGDGSSIEAGTINILKNIYLEEQKTFQWERGDVLMLDNLSVAHGRESYTGERLVLTAMSEPCDWNDAKIITV